MFDTHVHCEFSCDSQLTMKEIQGVLAENEKKFLPPRSFILTEHWDYDYPGEPLKFTFDREEYFRRFQPYRQENKLLLGIEVGMLPKNAAKDDAVAADRPFDYVLGSIHMLNGKDLYYPETYEGMSQEEAEVLYLETAAACVDNHDNFDALAHLDYICRYWPYTDQELHLQQHKALYRKLLRLLIEKDKPLEINTRRICNGGPAVKTMLELTRFYHELGGKYCTIGSDAHQKEHLSRALQLASIIAQESSLVPVYYCCRQRHIDRPF